MFWHTLDKYRDEGLLILRLGFGIGFLYFHGWRKLTSGPETWANYGDVMEHIGIGFWHTFFGFMAAFSESIGGVLIALGLFFRPVAILLCFTMIMASVSHIASGRGSPAHPLKNATLFLSLLFIGPGKYSLDELIRRRRQSKADLPGGGQENAVSDV